MIYDNPEHYFPNLGSNSLPTERNPRINEIQAINEIK